MFIERAQEDCKSLIWNQKAKGGMWLPKNHSDKKDGVNGQVAVAIDRDKGSQNALKWAVDNLLTRNSIVILIHVKTQTPSLSPSPSLFTPCEHTLFLSCSGFPTLEFS